MQSFRFLYFRESVLDHAEEVRVRDILEAIEKAAGKPSHLRAEVWSDRGRVGEIGVAPDSITSGRREGRSAGKRPEA